MALTDRSELKTSAPLTNRLAGEELPAAEWKKGASPAFLQALARLPQIHAETSETADLARFLRAAVGASAALMLMGALAIATASGATLRQEFAWSVLVLAGVGAMLRTYIKSVAQDFDCAPLREAARDLRAVLFYTGFAWGAGAFLLLGGDPVPFVGLCFAVLPSLLVTALLRDRAAALAFVAPMTLLTAAAILVQPWSDTIVVLCMLLLAEGGITVGLTLPPRAQPNLPPGLSLR
jgi:hypothetical protein